MEKKREPKLYQGMIDEKGEVSCALTGAWDEFEKAMLGLRILNDAIEEAFHKKNADLIRRITEAMQKQSQENKRKLKANADSKTLNETQN